MDFTYYEYLPLSIPTKLNTLLVNRGYKDTKDLDPKGLRAKLADYVSKKPELAIKDVVAIHPDRRLFEAVLNTKEDYFNCCLADAGLEPIKIDDKEKKGDAVIPKTEPAEYSTKIKLPESTINTIILAGAIIFAIAIFAKHST